MWSIGRFFSGKWWNNFFLVSCFLWVPWELNCQSSLLRIRLIRLFWIHICFSHALRDSIYPRGSETTLMNQNNNCFYFSMKLHTLICFTCFITCLYWLYIDTFLDKVKCFIMACVNVHPVLVKYKQETEWGS